MASLGHEDWYYSQRKVSLDLRGTLVIDAGSHWGFNITVITQSHSTREWDRGFKTAVVDRPVVVESGAWIGSNSVLYNCKIGQGAIVAIGTVVRSQEVAPFVMVAGNPAQVIARYINGEWWHVGPKWEVLE